MPTLGFCMYAVSYLLFFACLVVAKRYHANRITTEDGAVTTSPLLLALHVVGIGLFGLVPLLVTNFSYPAFSAKTSGELPTFLILVLVVILLFFSPRLASVAVVTPYSQERYPSLFYLAGYFLLRIIFIATYESWFRGFLLTDSIVRFGLPASVYLNVGLYALLHTVNGKKEMVGCIPFGLLLCGMCLWRGAVWPAIALHLALTLPYEVIRIKRTHKKLQYAGIRHRRIGLHRA